MANGQPVRGQQWEERHRLAGAPPALTGDLSTLAQQVGYLPGQANWLERVENYSPWNDVFSMEQQESELVVDVPFDNRYLFLIYCLGYNRVEGTQLKRINPLPHPYWTWMRCARVAYKGVRFDGTKVYTNGGPTDPGTAKYRLARFSLGFAAYPWRFYEDAQINSALGHEIYRNTYYEFQPTTQMLAAEGGAAILKKPFNKSGRYAPAIKNSFRAPFGTPMNQIRYKLHWKWVPFDYIFKDFIPVNFMSIMNTVNEFTFIGGGMVPGTVRFEQPEIKTYVSPIRGGPSYSTWPTLSEILCDVTVNFTYFDPPRKFLNPGEVQEFSGQVNAPAGSNAGAVRGHNLVPRRDDNLWEPATRPPLATTDNPDPATGIPANGNQLFRYANHYLPFIKPT